MATVGYARVSSLGQSLDIQRQKLAHCDKLYEDKLSGTTADRPALKKCLDYVREGDKVVVTKLDRLARSTFHLTQIAEKLKEKNVELVVIDQSIDTSTSTGKLLFNMLGAIGEFENEIRRERQLEGINAAKEKGIKFGAKPKLNSDQIAEMKKKRNEGVLIKDLMQEYRLSKASVYRLLKD